MKKYDASSIKIFKGLEAVRKRPGMYIGNVDERSGLHRMVFEVVDNSIDEGLAGYCDLVKIVLRSDGFVMICDNGRGMPIDLYKDEGKSAAEIIMTVLHAGAKFDEKVYRLSGGLHGVGVSVVNALSEKLYLRIFRSGFVYEQVYSYGKPTCDLKIVGHTDQRGTVVEFRPDPCIFRVCQFDYNDLLYRFRELSFLNSNIRIVLIDERSSSVSTELLSNNGGIKAFIEYINRSKSVVHADVLYFVGKKDGITVNVAIQWVVSSREKILCYTNNIYQRDGGSHLVGFKNILTKVLKSYIEEYILKSKDKIVIQGDDIRESVVAVLSVYMSNPKFSSQIKDKLISLEARQAVESILSSQLTDFLYENPVISKLISTRVIFSARVREAAKKARDLSKKKLMFDNISLCAKLSDCQEQKPSLSELFLVEGDSAGGSAKLARDRRTQAILPLRGKILNAERANFDKILSSSEIISIVNALRCGVGSNEYNEDKLRYHKIIFMTDADVDGAHIRTLLMTFFYRQMPELIKNGHVFVSKPPLYRFKKGKNDFYIKNKVSFNNFLFDSIFEELSKINIFEHNLLKFTLNLYKEILIILDELSHKYPRVLFEAMLYFNEYIFLNDLGTWRSNLSVFQLFLNKFIKSGQKIFLKYDSVFNSLNICFIKYGVLTESKLDLNFFSSNNYSMFREFNKYLNLSFIQKDTFVFNNESYNFYNFNKLINVMTKKVMSGYVVQRYKGLGEMNPDQLWETAMNPKTRYLYKVNIKDIILANGIFSSLMGECIDDRRKFIEDYAHSFSDIDI